ncbi:MAG: hypothetical protein GF350_06680 [Chitinivibrionales bacterium]|nr:hypothetical protein [Chitinivibrionales bacterium]
MILSKAKNGLINCVLFFVPCLVSSVHGVYDQGYGYDIHLGMRNIRVVNGTAVSVPVYLANFEDFGIYSCEFTILADSSCAIHLEQATVETGIAAGWRVSSTKVSDNRITIALEGSDDYGTVSSGAGALYYGAGELVVCKLGIDADFHKTKSCDIALAGISMQSEQGTIKPPAVQRKVKGAQGIEIVRSGDIDNNNKVQKDDADAILTYVVHGGADISNQYAGLISADRADVYIDGSINAYDAALVSLYGIGLVAELPIIASPGRVPDTPRVKIERLSSGRETANDLYQYRLSGSEIGGLISAQAEFAVDPEVIQQIKPPVTTAVKGARIAGYYNAAARTYKVALITNDRVDADEKDLFILNILHNADMAQSGLQLLTMMVNEQSVPVANVDPPAASPAGVGQQHSAGTKSGLIVISGGFGGRGRAKIQNSTGAAFAFFVYAANGKLVYSRACPEGTYEAPVSTAGNAPGPHLLVIRKSRMRISTVLPFYK